MRFGALLAVAAVAATATAAATEKRQFGGFPGFGGGGGGGGGAASGTIELDPAQTYQTMDGFGFSLAFQRANLITNNPSDKYRDELMELLFSRETGAGFSILRNGIGSSPDSSSDHMNTFAPQNPGGPDAEPKYQWDGKDSGQLWVTKTAVEKYGLEHVYGNAWSPPGYMKTNNNENNGGNLSPQWYQAFADYLVQYVQYYAAEGVNVTFLGPMNEPDYSASYASCLWNGQQAANFIKVLKSTIDAAGYGSQVKITCCETAGWGNGANMLNGIKSGGAESMLGAVTSHTYMGGASGRMNTQAPVWLSEQCDLNGQWSTGWQGGAGGGMTWANNVMGGILNNNLGGYLYWEGVQWPDPNTNEKMIRVDEGTGAYEVATRFYALGQFARFVRPDAVRIGTSGGSGMQIAAFKNKDKSYAVVLIAGGSGGSVTVKLPDDFAMGEAGVWASDAQRKLEKIDSTISGQEVTVEVPGSSVTTFWIKEGSAAAAAAAPVAEPEPVTEEPAAEK